MTHRVTLNNLVLDYKRATEGKGCESNTTLGALIGVSVATVVPLPNMGPYGSAQAVSELLTPAIRVIGSDATELMPFCTNLCESVAAAMYVNRYDTCWGGARALESFSHRQIIEEAFGVEIWQTLSLWAPRFIEACRDYYHEALGVGQED